MYTDEGITGTTTKHRAGFQSMVTDALAGKIDLIVTKSVSRFARNTVDSLTTMRQLKDAGIEVFFEKENTWTFDAKGELLITIMSSLTQEEARSISENVTWGHRKRFADGKVTVPFSRFLGYERGEDGNLVINQEQAKLVRHICTLYLDGGSLTGIAKQLQAEGHLTASGNPNWSAHHVRSILTNEKYKGDALLQKSYITDFLTKKQVKNQGEVPQYYVNRNHEPIITPAVWDFVQAELAAPATGRRSSSRQRSFSGKIRCAQCGAWYGSKTWHSGTKYEKTHLAVQPQIRRHHPVQHSARQRRTHHYRLPRRRPPPPRQPGPGRRAGRPGGACRTRHHRPTDQRPRQPASRLPLLQGTARHPRPNQHRVHPIPMAHPRRPRHRHR
ncbi:MAG: recombinase family protein [Cutibacterium sp.]|nr:recombinase family protein [Cutibacterium sp.]MDO4412096.1 recombinase family protein [Cutibacterium sp.]